MDKMATKKEIFDLCNKYYVSDLLFDWKESVTRENITSLWILNKREEFYENLNNPDGFDYDTGTELAYKSTPVSKDSIDMYFDYLFAYRHGHYSLDFWYLLLHVHEGLKLNINVVYNWHEIRFLKFKYNDKNYTAIGVYYINLTDYERCLDLFLPRSLEGVSDFLKNVSFEDGYTESHITKEYDRIKLELELKLENRVYKKTRKIFKDKLGKITPHEYYLGKKNIITRWFYR